MTSTGLKLRDMRRRAGLTQSQLATALGYGCGQFVSNWERGVSTPPAASIKPLAYVLNVQPRRLVDLLYAHEIARAKEWRREMLESLRGAP